MLPVRRAHARRVLLREEWALLKPLTVVAEAVRAGTGGALVHVDFAAGAGEASATVTAEARWEPLLVQLLHTHASVLARVVGLAGQVLAIWTLSWAKKRKKERRKDTLEDVGANRKKRGKNRKQNCAALEISTRAFYRQRV